MAKINIAKLKEKVFSKFALKIPAKFKPLIEKIEKNPKLKKKIIVFIIVVSAIAVIFGAYEKIKWSNIIKASGVIEGDEVRISFRVEGQIEELLADEGWLLKEGQIVAKLNKDELTKERDNAKAALIKAERQLELDNLDHARAENLFTEGAISAQDRDTAKTKAGTTSATVDQLRAQLELAEVRLGWADLASPLNGYIISKSCLQGEVVQIGEPVFTAVDLNNIWVTTYINERDLGKVKLNQKAFVKADSYPFKKYNGWISFISQQTEFTPKYIQTTEERVKYVYRIKVRVDNSSMDLKPGMPADAYIITK